MLLPTPASLTVLWPSRATAAFVDHFLRNYILWLHWDTDKCNPGQMKTFSSTLEGLFLQILKETEACSRALGPMPAVHNGSVGPLSLNARVGFAPLKK